MGDAAAVLERPDAVLLDAGGVLVEPDLDRLLAAFDRAEVDRPSTDRLRRAIHVAAARFSTERDVDADWAGSWEAYLADLVDECLAERDDPVDVDGVHRHLDSEFADAALWCEPVDGVVEALERLACVGIRLGVVSNADGMMAPRLAGLEIVQVGPGPGVQVECVVDSGAVGVMKPDPRIFSIALEAMGLEPHRAWFVGDMPAFDVVGARRAGLRPWLIDPAGLHRDTGLDRIASLAELADLVGA